MTSVPSRSSLAIRAGNVLISACSTLRTRRASTTRSVNARAWHNSTAPATTAGADLSRHNRAALGRNAAFLRELLGAGQCDRRVGVVRKACKQNVRMARGVIRQLSDVWTEAFKAARRPYQAKRAHAAK